MKKLYTKKILVFVIIVSLFLQQLSLFTFAESPPGSVGGSRNRLGGSQTEEDSDITGIVWALGLSGLEPEALALTLYADGEVQAEAPSFTAIAPNQWEYRFEGLSAEEELSYTIKPQGNLTGFFVYHVANGAVIGQDADFAPSGTDFHCIAPVEFTVDYRVQREETDPPAENVRLRVENTDEEWLIHEDTASKTVSLPGYDPLTGEPVVYRAYVAENAPGYEASCENLPPYEEESDFAYAGGTVINRFAPPMRMTMGVLAENPWKADGTGAFTASVNWNDNNDSGSKRPAPAYTGVEMSLLVTVEGEEEPQPLTAELLASWGVAEEEIAGILAPATINNENPETSAAVDNFWYFTFDKLPEKLVKEEPGVDDEGEEIVITTERSLTYTLDTITGDSLSSYIVERKSDTLVMNTLQTDTGITKVWNDAGNTYGTRPGIEALLAGLTLSAYYVENGEEIYPTPQPGSLSGWYNAETVKPGDPVVTVTGADSSQWAIQITGAPAFIESGHPLYYFVTETDKTLATVNSDKGWENVVYSAAYSNVGNRAERYDVVFDGGTITNTLSDSITIDATKVWQDDGADETKKARPTGTFSLRRYPRVSGRDYINASPVAGMELELDKATDQYALRFTADNKFPRFDVDGFEYVYLIRETYKGEGAALYSRYYSYDGISIPEELLEDDVLYNGGVIENRRTGTIDLSVTKRWMTAALQNLTSSVTLSVQRRTKGSDEAFADFTGSGVVDGRYTISGFSADVIEKEVVFAELPQFDERGIEYEYKVEEAAIQVGEDSLDLLAEGSTFTDDNGVRYCVLGGYTFKLEETVNEAKTTYSLTNTLVGKTEVRIKKQWNSLKEGTTPPDATFYIAKDGKKLDGTYTIAGPDASLRLIRDEGDYSDSDWLVVDGFDRYDKYGQEYKYTVTENKVEGYHTTYSTSRSQEPDEKGRYFGVVETTVTNTPGTGGGHVVVRKQWWDYGDENCRGPVTAELYYNSDPVGNPEGWTKVNQGDMTASNDWEVWIALKGIGSDGKVDVNYSHYYVREVSVKRKGSDYPIAPLDENSLFPAAVASVTLEPMGTLVTDAHRYNCFTTLDSTLRYYTFRNVRVGTVNIDLSKKWTDDNHQRDELHQAVTLQIKRRLIYDETTFEDCEAVAIPSSADGKIELDGTVDLIETEAWKASVVDLPKYNSQGVPYSYFVREVSVRETQILEDGNWVDCTTPAIPVSYDLDGSGSYQLASGERHQYAVGVEDVRVYGEHVTGNDGPEPDQFTIGFTNARSATITVQVHKVWKDVVRDLPQYLDGEGNRHAGELQDRPDIYMELHRTIDGKTETLKKEASWDTSQLYHWICSFSDLPRYTAGGKLITYTVSEGEVSMGDYTAAYYDAAPAALTSGDAYHQLRKITEKPIYDVSGEESDNRAVSHGGTIVNTRQGERTLTGQKIWKNLPKGMSTAFFPDVTFRMQIYLNEVDGEGNNVYIPVAKAGAVVNQYLDGSLTSEKTQFVFEMYQDATPVSSLPKYDAFGVINRYMAKEIFVEETDGQELVPGYFEPVTDDYNLTVTNEYISDPALYEKVHVSVTKAWTHPWALEPGEDPEAVLELWRCMTDKDGNDITTDASGNPLPDAAYPVPTEEPVEGETTDSTPRTWTVKLSDGNTPHVFENLPKYGYNGMPYRYFLKEKLNGYKIEGLETVANTTANSENEAVYHFAVTNHYTGITADFIQLGGVKTWSDQSNKYSKRPDAATPEALGFKVYRQSKKSDGTLIGTPVELLSANLAELVWNTDDDATGKWRYTVKALDISAGDTSTDGGRTPSYDLYRYDPHGREYVYYVFEPAIRHYNTAVTKNTGATAITNDWAKSLGDGLVLRAAANKDGTVTADFTNSLQTVNCTVTKQWKKQLGSGVTTAMTQSELALMLPASITFQLQYHDGSGWSDFTINGTEQLVTLSRATLLEKIGEDGTISAVYNSLPKWDDATPQNLMKYRLVETKIGNEAISSDAAGGFAVDNNDADTGSNEAGANHTVTNTLATVPLTIQKDFDDDENQDGQRPLTITFTIARDGDDTQTMTVTLDKLEGESDSQAWARWKDTGLTVYVPEYQADGVTKSTYAVTEADITDYTAVENPIADPGDTKVYAFENQYTAKTMSVKAVKSWSDSAATTVFGSTDSFRPAEITVTLQRRIKTTDNSGEWADMGRTSDWDYSPTATLSPGSDGWSSHTWSSLPCRTNSAGGSTTVSYWEYQVVEASISGYTPTSTAVYELTTVGEDGAAVSTITNTLDVKKLAVTKAWDDKVSSNPFAVHNPVTVTLLYRQGTGEWQATSLTKTLNATNSWKNTFTNLPAKDKNGVDYQYTVREATINGYTSAVSTPSAITGGWSVTVTNTLTTRSTGITVTKAWDDKDNQDGKRPAVQVKLYKDKGVTGEERSSAAVTLTGSGWSHTWSNLPAKRANGDDCVYTVEEVSTITPYTASYSIDGSNWAATCPTISGNAVTVKNSYTPAVMSLSVSKAWAGEHSSLSIRPDSVTLTLQRRLTGDTTWTNVSKTTAWNQEPSVTLTHSNGTWATHQWTNLPCRDNSSAANSTMKLWQYRVVETAVNGYTATYSADFINEASTTKAITVTNTLNTTSLAVTKSWNDKSSPFTVTKPDAVTVELLYRTSSTADWTASGVTKTLTATAPAWQATFTGLPQKDGSGNSYLYSVREISVDGKVLANDEYLTYTPSVENGTGTSAVTNNLATRSITVTKAWDDANNQDGKRLDSVTVKLVQDGVTDTDNVTLSASNSWSYTWANLPTYKADGTTAHVYTVVEVSDPSPYTASYSINGSSWSTTCPTISGNAVTVKNSYTPAVMSLSVSKAWAGEHADFDTRPDSVTLTLQRRLTGDTTWTNVSKTTAWNYEPSVTLTHSNGTWATHQWTNLPCRNNSGTANSAMKRWQYRVVETAVNGYTATYSAEYINEASTTKAITVTNTLNTVTVSLSKSWSDYANRYASRPDSLTFVLQGRTGTNAFADLTDSVTAEPLSLTLLRDDAPTALTQSGQITGLPICDKQGNAYDYRFVERSYTTSEGIRAVTYASDQTSGSFTVEDSGFDYAFSSVTGKSGSNFTTTITNRILLPVVSISGTKTWEDAGNQFRSRPEEVALTLFYKDSSHSQWTAENTSLYTVQWVDNEDGTWDYTIADLQKFTPNDTQIRQYSVREEASPDYTRTLPVLSDDDSRYITGTADTNGDITGADLTNALDLAETLSVTKRRDRTEAAIFRFTVWVSRTPITAENPGILYTGAYTLTNSDGSETLSTGSDGVILLEGDETFTISGLPLNWYYQVIEEEHFEYALVPNQSSALEGRLGSVPIEALAYNEAVSRLGIENTTENHGIDQNGKTNAGGKVTIAFAGHENPDKSDEDAKENELQVAWNHNRNWMFGDSFTVEYTKFGDPDTVHSFTIGNYTDSSGRLLPQEEWELLDGNTDDFPDLEITQKADDHILLTLAKTVADMPSSVIVKVEFCPTLAVNNCTEENRGGQVYVDNGQPHECSDGVPSDGGSPYRAMSVYGVPEEGYMVDPGGLTVYNLDDPDGDRLPLSLTQRPDSRISMQLMGIYDFAGELRTTIAGVPTAVRVAGWVTFQEETVEITFDDPLPVPLQVDIRFVPIPKEEEEIPGRIPPKTEPERVESGGKDSRPPDTTPATQRKNGNASSADGKEMEPNPNADNAVPTAKLPRTGGRRGNPAALPEGRREEEEL